MKNLLIVTDTFLPKLDGVTRFLTDLTPYLTEKFNLTIVAPSYNHEEKEKYLDAEIVRLKTLPLEAKGYRVACPNIKLMKTLIKKTDIVWVQLPITLGLSATFVSKRLRKKLISYVHVTGWKEIANGVRAPKPIRWFIYFLLKIFSTYIYKNSELIMSPSINIARELSEKGIKSKKEIIEVGTNIHKFVPPVNKEEAKKAIGIAENKTVIGYCGRISREKNLITLYEAFTELKNLHDDLVLLLVGSGDKDRISFFSKDEDVMITGFKENVVPYLQAMDIFVMPSLTETSSLSTIEAMSCGLAVIATPVGHIKDYIESNYNGLLFPRQHHSILAKKIERLLFQPKLRKKLGRNARATVIQSLTLGKTAKKMIEVIKSV